MQLLLTQESVDRYLTKHGLETGATPVSAVLLQTQGGTASGRPAVMLIAEIDGQKRVLKMTLNTLVASVEALKAVAAKGGWRENEQQVILAAFDESGGDPDGT